MKCKVVFFFVYEEVMTQTTRNEAGEIIFLCCLAWRTSSAFPIIAHTHKTL